MTDVDYIDILIQSEKSEVNPGWFERVEHLEDQKKLAIMIADAQDPNFNPFEKFEKEKSYAAYIKEKIVNFFSVLPFRNVEISIQF
jgi:hypothetical protein